MSLINIGGLPGMGAPALSTEVSFLWAADTWYLTKSITLNSAAVDSGNSPTTDLRPGLVLGKITATLDYSAYVAANTDGTQIAEGVLFAGIRMLNILSGSAESKQAVMVVGGPVKGGQLTGIDNVSRAQLFGRFIFDDNLYGVRDPIKKEIAKTADYVIVAGDNETLFTNTGAVGAVNFTLPARAAGLMFEFMVVANQNLTVTSAAGTDIVTANNASASSIAFTTGGDKIGGHVRLYSNMAGTKWYVEKLCSNAMTIA